MSILATQAALKKEQTGFGTPLVATARLERLVVATLLKHHHLIPEAVSAAMGCGSTSETSAVSHHRLLLAWGAARKVRRYILRELHAFKQGIDASGSEESADDSSARSSAERCREYEISLCAPLERRAVFLLRQLLPAHIEVAGPAAAPAEGELQRSASRKRWQAAAKTIAARVRMQAENGSPAGAVVKWQGTAALARSLQKRAARLRRHPTSGRLPMSATLSKYGVLTEKILDFIEPKVRDVSKDAAPPSPAQLTAVCRLRQRAVQEASLALDDAERLLHHSPLRFQFLRELANHDVRMRPKDDQMYGAGQAASTSFTVSLHRLLGGLLRLLQDDTTPLAQETLVLSIFCRPLGPADAEWVVASGLIKTLHTVSQRRADPLSRSALFAVCLTAAGGSPQPAPTQFVLRTVAAEQLEDLPNNDDAHASRMLQLVTLLMPPSPREPPPEEVSSQLAPILASIAERHTLGWQVRALALRLLGRVLPSAEPSVVLSMCRGLCASIGAGLWCDGTSGEQPCMFRGTGMPPVLNQMWAWGAPPMETRELPVCGLIVCCTREHEVPPNAIRIQLPPGLQSVKSFRVFTLPLDKKADDDTPLTWVRTVTAERTQAPLGEGAVCIEDGSVEVRLPTTLKAAEKACIFLHIEPPIKVALREKQDLATSLRTTFSKTESDSHVKLSRSLLAPASGFDTAELTSDGTALLEEPIRFGQATVSVELGVECETHCRGAFVGLVLPRTETSRLTASMRASSMIRDTVNNTCGSGMQWLWSWRADGVCSKALERSGANFVDTSQRPWHSPPFGGKKYRLKLVLDTRTMTLTAFSAQVTSTGQRLAIPTKDWVCHGSTCLEPLPRDVSIHVGACRYFDVVRVTACSVQQSCGASVGLLSSSPVTEAAKLQRNTHPVTVAHLVVDTGGMVDATQGGFGAPAPAASFGVPSPAFDSSPPATKDGVDDSTAPPRLTIGAHGLLNGDVAAALCYDEPQHTNKWLRAERVNTLRLLLSESSAVDLLLDALDGASCRAPPAEVCALALGVLHVIGTEADGARLGAMGAYAGHKVQLLSTPGPDGTISVARFAHSLPGDEQEVVVEDAKVEDVSVAIPSIAALPSVVKQLASAVGYLLHIHLPHCALGGAAGPVASHTSLALASYAVAALKTLYNVDGEAVRKSLCAQDGALQTLASLCARPLPNMPRSHCGRLLPVGELMRQVEWLNDSLWCQRPPSLQVSIVLDKASLQAARKYLKQKCTKEVSRSAESKNADERECGQATISLFGTPPPTATPNATPPTLPGGTSYLGDVGAPGPAAAAAGGGGGLFGAPAPAPADGGLFGASAPAAGGPFGAPAPAAAAAGGGGGLFGAPAPAPADGGLFGASAPAAGGPFCAPPASGLDAPAGTQAAEDDISAPGSTSGPPYQPVQVSETVPGAQV